MIYSNNRTKLNYNAQYDSIIESYCSLLNDDYNMFNSSAILTEAFNLSKIISVIKEGWKKLVAKAKELIGKLIERIKVLAKKIKVEFNDRKYEKLSDKIDKAFSNNAMVTVNAQDIIIDPDYYKLSSIDGYIYEGANEATAKFHRLGEVNNVDFEKDDIDEKISTLHESMMDVIDEYSDLLDKNIGDYDVDSIFFKDTRLKNIKIDKKTADRVWGNLYMKDNALDNIVELFKDEYKFIDQAYNTAIECFTHSAKGFNNIRYKNGTQEQYDDYDNRIASEYSSCMTKLLQKCYSTNGSISGKIVASYKKWIDANKDILKKVLKAAKINPDSKEDGAAISPEFEKAVKEKDLMTVKIMLKDTIILDCRNNFNKLKAMLNYANSRVPDLIEKDDGASKLDYNKRNWTVDAFNLLLVKLVHNFSQEKLDLACQMAQYLFQ